MRVTAIVTPRTSARRTFVAAAALLATGCTDAATRVAHDIEVGAKAGCRRVPT